MYHIYSHNIQRVEGEPRRGDRDLAQGEAKRNPGLNQTTIQIHSNPGGVVAEYGKRGKQDEKLRL